jgi:predicted transcriptional regulator
MADRGFSKKDEVLVDLLMGTGMPKNVARMLAFVRKKEETNSVEIEVATGLRQPEVSIAVQELRRRKWIIKRDIKKEGKGRPVHSYKLAMPFDKIVEILEREERKRIERIESNIEQLKTTVAR